MAKKKSKVKKLIAAFQRGDISIPEAVYQEPPPRQDQRSVNSHRGQQPRPPLTKSPEHFVIEGSGRRSSFYPESRPPTELDRRYSYNTYQPAQPQFTQPIQPIRPVESPFSSLNTPVIRQASRPSGTHGNPIQSSNPMTTMDMQNPYLRQNPIQSSNPMTTMDMQNPYLRQNPIQSSSTTNSTTSTSNNRSFLSALEPDYLERSSNNVDRQAQREQEVQRELQAFNELRQNRRLKRVLDSNNESSRKRKRRRRTGQGSSDEDDELLDDMEDDCNKFDGGMPIAIGEDGTQRLHNPNPKSKKKKKPKKKTGNRYQRGSSSSSEGSSSESEKDIELVEADEAYQFTEICERFHHELLLNAASAELHPQRFTEFEKPTNYVKPVDIFQVQRRPTMKMDQDQPEDRIRDIDEEIARLKSALNNDNGALIQKRLPTGQSKPVFACLELIKQMERRRFYQQIGDFRPRVNHSDDEEHEYPTILFEALNASKQDDLKFLLPDYIRYMAKLKPEGYDPYQLFEIVIGNKYAAADVACWREVFPALLTDYEGFNVDRINSTFERALEHLANLIYGDTIKQDVKTKEIIQLIQDIIIAWARLDIEIGDTSRVVMLLQVVGEFYFAEPKEICRTSFESRFGALKKFFDSGYARFGEIRSKGWCKQHPNYLPTDCTKNQQMEERNFSELLEKSTEEEEQQLANMDDSDLSLGNIWSNIERQRAVRHWQPAKFKNDQFPNKYFSIDNFRTILKATQARERCPDLILRLLQVLGASFGQLPLSVDKRILVNDHFEKLILNLLPESFTEFQQDNLELYDFLISFMFQLCQHQKEDNSTKMNYALITGIVETTREKFANDRYDGDKVAELDKLKQRFAEIYGKVPDGRRQFTFNEYDFAFVQLLNLRADVENNFGYPSSWVAAEASPTGTNGTGFAKSEVFKQLVGIINALGALETVTRPQDRALIFLAVTHVLRRLDSFRDGEQAFNNRARFLVLFTGVERRRLDVKTFLDKERFKLQDHDLTEALQLLKDKYETETYESRTELEDTIGTPKDLLLQITACMHHEVTGSSLYEEMHNNHKMSSTFEEDEKKESIRDAVYVGQSILFRFYRLEFNQPMVRRGFISAATHNEWSFDLLERDPLHLATWINVLPAIEWNHCLVERYIGGKGCCSVMKKSAKHSLLHRLLVFVTQWNEDILYDKQQQVRIRQTLQKALNEAKLLNYADTTVARLSLLFETYAGTSVEEINKQYRDRMKQFPYARVCTFDTLPNISQMDEHKLDGIDDFIAKKGYRTFISKKDLDKKLDQIAKRA